MNAGGETFKTEFEARAAGEEGMFRMLEVVLFRIGDTFGTGVGGEIGSFGEDEEPHWIVFCLRELLETVTEPRSIFLPVASHEDYLSEINTGRRTEAVKLHSPADNWDPFETVFQDDVDGSVHIRSIRYPPTC